MAKAKKKVTKKRAKKKASVSRGTQPLTTAEKVQARKDLRAEQAQRYKAG